MQSEGQEEDLSSLRTDNNLDVTENMGAKIFIPVKRLTKLHENEAQISAILKGISVIIKRNNNTDKMITFLGKEIQLQESMNSGSLKSCSIINNARIIPPHIISTSKSGNNYV